MEHTPKCDLRVDNVYFLKHVGGALRKASADVTKEELPEEIRLALESLEAMLRGPPRRDPAA